jgi:hypothetical protein
VESFRAQLQTENQCEIEQLKAQLQITTATHQIQFASLHAKIAEVVAEIYARIVRVKRAVTDYVKIMESSKEPSKEERRKVLAQAFGDFHDYCGTHRLYLPKESIKIVNYYDRLLFETADEFMWLGEMPLAKGGHHDVKAWSKAHRTIAETVPTLLEILEDDFRRLLGQATTSEQKAI